MYLIISTKIYRLLLNLYKVYYKYFGVEIIYFPFIC